MKNILNALKGNYLEAQKGVLDRYTSPMHLDPQPWAEFLRKDAENRKAVK